MHSGNVGIQGIGVYLPGEVRRNDWWSPELVARWRALRAATPSPPVPSPLSEGAQRVLRAFVEQQQDPFQGTRTRHIMPEGMTLIDMEEQAARAALAHAGAAPGSIDLLLTASLFPDHLLGNPACPLHRRLGLPHACGAINVDVSSYAFLVQLAIAESMIRAGRASRALIVQSCIPSRLLDMEDPDAPFFGDAATAAVVGPVGADRGIEATVTFTDGRNPRTLVASVRGAPWYAAGRPVIHVADAAQTLAVFLQAIDAFKESVEAVLARASRAVADVDFFCIHQGAPWVRRIAQEYAGLTRARSVETFSETGYVFASTLPIALAKAEAERQLAAGDVVLLTSGGPGIAYGATILRWGSS